MHEIGKYSNINEPLDFFKLILTNELINEIIQIIIQ